jgi:hypothetical protein
MLRLYFESLLADLLGVCKFIACMGVMLLPFAGIALIEKGCPDGGIHAGATADGVMWNSVTKPDAHSGSSK